MKVVRFNIWQVLAPALLLLICCNTAYSQTRRSVKSYVEGGILIPPDTTKVGAELPDSLGLKQIKTDSLAVDSLSTNLVTPPQSDSLYLEATPAVEPDSLATPLALKGASPLHVGAAPQDKVREPLISDSMSLSRMSWFSLALPGFGQVYNKQYWKLPILYGTVGAGIALYVNENKRYKPLKAEYENLLLSAGSNRNKELNAAQAAMIHSNTRRQLYLGAAIASYVYFIGDAAINYSTNDVSDVKKATTLSMICPGAGQIYNKSYWRVPIVVGMFATTLYVYDWNNRGYQRFKTAYALKLEYDNDPEKYPNGSPDEFNGRYSTSNLKGYRDSYRRNRDLAVILTAGAYLLQVLDAHVDAHLKDFDISDDLTFSPTLNYTTTSTTDFAAVGGFNLNFKF